MTIALLGIHPGAAAEVRAALADEAVAETREVGVVEELVREGRLRALVVGEVPEPIRLVQRIHAADPSVPAIIAVPAAAMDALRKPLWFTPLVGEDVRVVEAEDVDRLAEEVRDAVAGADARRSYGRTLEAARAPLLRLTPRPQPGVFLGQLLHHAPIGVVIVDRAGVVLAWNRAASEMLGVAESAALGSRFADLFASRGRVAALVDQAFEAREPAPEVHEFGGRAIEISGRAVDTAERERAVMMLLSDVTARVVAERRSQQAIEHLSLLARVGQVLSSSLTTAAALEQFTRLLVEDFVDWAVVYVARDDGSLERIAVAQSSRVDRDPAELTRAPAIPAGPGPGEVFETGRVKVWDELPDDLAAAGADPRYIERVRELGIHAAAAVPVVARGRSFGVLGVASAAPGHRFGDGDVSLLEQVARRAAIALDNARLYEEARVAEARVRTLVNSVDAILWEARGPQREFTLVTERAEEILGYPTSTWLQHEDFWAGVIHPDDRDATLAEARRAITAGRDHALEYRAIAADGREVWLRDRVYVEAGDDRHRATLRGIMVDVTEEKEARRALEHSRQRYAHIARTLQGSLLPPTLPAIPGLALVARYRAAGADVDVGGDFYDAFRIDDSSWGVSIGDVGGKGVKAAVLTALARHTIRANGLRLDRPAEVLEALNEAILREDRDDRFCTAAYIRLSKGADGFHVDLAVGGHPLPLVLRAGGSVERLGTPSLLLGALPDADIAESSSLLRPGDTLVLYTDGVLDAGAPQEPLGEEGLRGACLRASERGAKGIADEIESAVAAKAALGNARDDVALLVAEVE